MEEQTPIASAAERRRQERSVWRAGLLASALVHLLIFVLWPAHSILLSPFSAAGPAARDASPAAGSMQAMNVRVPPRMPIVPPPVPVPVEIEIEPVEIVEEPPTLDAEALGIGRGLDAPGADTGTGRGDGGTSDEGLYRMIPPAPRSMIIPPSSERLKGREVEVWVFVDERGRVVADSTQLRPPTSDASFNRQLIREAAEWQFRPATQGGEPVATWFPYRISM